MTPGLFRVEREIPGSAAAQPQQGAREQIADLAKMRRKMVVQATGR